MKPAPLVMLALLLSTFSCSKSNNLLFGRVEADVGGHSVVVTDCYRLEAPPPEQASSDSYRFAPCKDAVVLIKKGELTVNGRAYGQLKPEQGVLVDHGAVSLTAHYRRDIPADLTTIPSSR